PQRGNTMAKILIIDDSWLIRKTIAGYLKKNGYEYIEAVDGNLGLQAIGNQPIDCIILDLLMPGLNGIDVLKQLQERHNTIPVIILTADIQETTKEKCMGYGVVDFLQKPPKEEVLIYKLKKVLGLK
ncbi:MAG: response regulator, partial [Chitinivibrionales bacterium]|nr:response regulator [Chitinivibrionales bacterium]